MIVEKERSGPRTYVGVELAGLTDGLDGRLRGTEKSTVNLKPMGYSAITDWGRENWEWTMVLFRREGKNSF